MRTHQSRSPTRSGRHSEHLQAGWLSQRTRRRLSRRLSDGVRRLLWCLACMAPLAGCASTAPEAAAPAETTGEEAAPSNGLSDAFRDNAEALTRIEPTIDTDGPPPSANPEPTLDITGAEEPASPGFSPAQAGEDEAVEASAPAALPETPQQRRERLVAELAAALREEAAILGDPVRREVETGALLLLSPNATTLHDDLTDRERAILGAWREMFSEVRDGMRGSTGDIAVLPRAAQRLADRLANEQPLTISEAKLCARVEGFGRYTPLPRRLLAGRRHPAIVYVEVSHFGARRSAGPDGEAGHTVELAQELALYHDADGLLAWRRPEQTVMDFSRNRRRDFFIVQRVDLPRTLTVGAYRLKVTVRDRTTGETAEEIIPIEVVADAALIRGER